MYTCIYRCIHICIYIDTFVYTFTNAISIVVIHIFMTIHYIHMNTYICIYIYTHMRISISADPCRGGAQKLRSCMLTAQHYAAVAVFADSYRPSVASPFLL